MPLRVLRLMPTPDDFEDADQAGMIPAFAAEGGAAVKQFLRCRSVGQ